MYRKRGHALAEEKNTEREYVELSKIETKAIGRMQVVTVLKRP